MEQRKPGERGCTEDAWSPLLDALAYAYVRGWYDKEAKTDRGKIAVAREQLAKIPLYAAAESMGTALVELAECGALTARPTDSSRLREARRKAHYALIEAKKLPDFFKVLEK